MTKQIRSRFPIKLGVHDVRVPEMQFTQYMPIKLAGEQYTPSNLPGRVWPAHTLVERVSKFFGGFGRDDYVYLTVKRLWVPAGQTANREGWHIDGYGSDDLNFIWCDSIPTEVAIQNMELSDDHAVSLQQMATEVQEEHVHALCANTLYMLNDQIIHRCAVAGRGQMRTFIKISVSSNMYNLEGNAINEKLVYNWGTIPRDIERNHPTK